MFHKLVILSGLIVSATCMLLQQPPVPLYLPLQYQEPARNYDFAYQVNDARTGDFKRQQEARIGDTILGQYSLLQPDGLTRTVEYRANDDTGFNAVVNNEGRAYNAPSGRQDVNGEASRRQGNERAQEGQFQQSSDLQATPRPLTVERTALIHHVLRQYRHAL